MPTSIYFHNAINVKLFTNAISIMIIYFFDGKDVPENYIAVREDDASFYVKNIT